MSEALISVAFLKELLYYDSTLGWFMWRTDRGAVKAGSAAGSTAKDGYIMITINGKKYPAQRLAFLYREGTFPPKDTDHKNGNREDNRGRNIRPATRSENCRNMTRLSRHNTSGCVGVYWSKKRSKWVAQIAIGDKTKNLGGYASIEEAARVRLESKKLLHPGIPKTSPAYSGKLLKTRYREA